MSVVVLALLEEHDNSRQVNTCLEDCGYKVLVVSSFAKALGLLSTEKIDLIVSDVHLENGGTMFDFLRQVKKEGQRTCKIPFVIFSFKPSPAAKYLADGVRTTARYLGAAKYIEMETFDPGQFQEQIKSLLSPEDQSADTSKCRISKESW